MKMRKLGLLIIAFADVLIKWLVYEFVVFMLITKLPEGTVNLPLFWQFTGLVMIIGWGIIIITSKRVKRVEEAFRGKANA